VTQCNGISKIFETLYEGRFAYLNELENLGAKIEILNPYQAIVV
jgi:UDP-N-acetylglucosamine enolpyruvyl transferase